MLEIKRKPAGQNLYLILTLLATLTGCSGIPFEPRLDIEFAAYNQSVFLSYKSTDQIYAAFIKTAASKPFGLQATKYLNDLKTEVLHYEGKSEGIWPFNKCCWDEMMWFGMKIEALSKTKKKIVIYAHARQRQNSSWPWKTVDSFDRAAPYFSTFSKIFKENIDL